MANWYIKLLFMIRLLFFAQAILSKSKVPIQDYSNGKKRSKGYITNIDLSFVCFTKHDKAETDFYVVDFF